MPRTKTVKQKLGKPQTASYKPQPLDIWGLMPRDLPLFTWNMVRYMLWDQTIRLGLAMREAPIHSAEVAYKDGKDWVNGIKCDVPAIAQFVERQLQRFWTHDLRKILRAQIWGWAAGECLYRVNQAGQIEYDGLLQRSAADVRAMDLDGKQIGVRFRRIPKAKDGMVDLKFPECFWHAFMPEDGSFYGESVLKGPYSAWCDKYLDGGALDVRRLFMHADAYGGKLIRYPEGSTPVEENGGVRYIPNLDIARQMVAQLKAGGVVTMPSKFDGTSGKPLWDLNWASSTADPKHILEYPKDLDVEMLRGLEIPDDVLTSEGMTGAWAGKAVPQQAFYAGLDRWLTLLASDFKRQIADPLVVANFGREFEYEISFKPLAEQASEQSGDKEKDGQPGGFTGQVNPFAPRYQMSLEQAIGEGAVNAAQLVQGVRKALARKRPSTKRIATASTNGHA